MNHSHGGLLVLLMTFGIGALVANLLIACISLFISKQVSEECAPQEVARFATVGLILPMFLGFVAVGALLTVPALSLFFPGLDHCLADANAPHICFRHSTLVFGSFWEALGVLILASGLAISLLNELRRVLRAKKMARLLVGSNKTTPVLWTDDPLPYAFTLGLFRRQIVLSSGLRRELSEGQLDAAFAHEESHVHHYDALARVFLRVFSFLLLPTFRRRLLELLVLAQEKRADDEASEKIGSRILVAETLLALARTNTASFLDVPAVVGSALELRIESLCRSPAQGRLSKQLVVSVLGIIFVIFSVQAEIHAGAEGLVGALLSAPEHSHEENP